MKVAKKVLELLTDMYPPAQTEDGKGTMRHGILIVDGELTLSLMLEDGFYTYTIEHDDLDKTAEQIVYEIKAIHDNRQIQEK